MLNGFIYVVDVHFIDKLEEKKSWTQVPVVLASLSKWFWQTVVVTRIYNQLFNRSDINDR
jgi:hypothetical protein